jgi:transcriptional regulator with XRE-family HTH domain
LRVKKPKMYRSIRQRTRRRILKALRRARADAGLTISELAKRAGVSRDTISYAERGQHSLQAPTLSKIARALGRAPSELLAEEERLAPKARRSSLEPSLLDSLADERPGSRFAEAIVTVAERQSDDMSDLDMDDSQLSALVKVAIELGDLISGSVEEEDWEAIPIQERREIHATMDALGDVVRIGIQRLHKQFRENAEAAIQEHKASKEREKIREWNRRLGRSA